MSKSEVRLMFDEDDVRRINYPQLPRLVRVIFYGLGITTEGFLQRYARYFDQQAPDGKTKKEHSQKAASDRKFLHDHRKLSDKMFYSVLQKLGYDVESISVRIRDRMTGETFEFSTDNTVADLQALRSKADEIGVGGIE